MTEHHNAIIRVKNLEAGYLSQGSKSRTTVLRDVNFEIDATDFAIIYGPSGSGKSTLLHNIVGLESPDKGKIVVRGTDITKLNSEERAIFRAKKFGMIYQSSYWIKSLKVWENVALPLLIAGDSVRSAKEESFKALESAGITRYADKYPVQLSGGEQQRVGLARALVNNPWIVVADEPTGNLDTHSADEVIQILQELNIKHKRTVVMVTHNLSYLLLANKKIALRDGTVVSEGAEGVKREIRKELEGVL